jgi:hypothetical protein
MLDREKKLRLEVGVSLSRVLGLRAFARKEWPEEQGLARALDAAIRGRRAADG